MMIGSVQNRIQLPYILFSFKYRKGQSKTCNNNYKSKKDIKNKWPSLEPFLCPSDDIDFYLNCSKNETIRAISLVF